MVCCHANTNSQKSTFPITWRRMNVLFSKLGFCFWVIAMHLYFVTSDDRIKKIWFCSSTLMKKFLISILDPNLAELIGTSHKKYQLHRNLIDNSVSITPYQDANSSIWSLFFISNWQMVNLKAIHEKSLNKSLKAVFKMWGFAFL